MCVWATGPYTSNASTLSFLADIPVVLIAVILCILVLKALLFNYEKYNPDRDPRGRHRAFKDQSSFSELFSFFPVSDATFCVRAFECFSKVRVNINRRVSCSFLS